MDVKIEAPRKFRVQIGEQIYEITKPKMAHQVKLEGLIKRAQQDSSSLLEPMIDYVSELGLPKEVILEMEQDDFTLLVEKLSGSKKN